jgi:hypothetical protein
VQLVTLKTQQYQGPLGEFVISVNDQDHESAIASGKLSCGPDMIDAVKEIREIFPGALVVRMGAPDKETQCDADRDTSAMTRKQDQQLRQSEAVDIISEPKQPHARAKLYASKHQRILFDARRR